MISAALAGCTILLPVDRRAGELTAALERHGAAVRLAPALTIVPHIDDEELIARSRELIARPARRRGRHDRGRASAAGSRPSTRQGCSRSSSARSGPRRSSPADPRRAARSSRRASPPTGSPSPRPPPNWRSSCSPRASRAGASPCSTTGPARTGSTRRSSRPAPTSSASRSTAGVRRRTPRSCAGRSIGGRRRRVRRDPVHLGARRAGMARLGRDPAGAAGDARARGCRATAHGGGRADHRRAAAGRRLRAAHPRPRPAGLARARRGDLLRRRPRARHRRPRRAGSSCAAPAPCSTAGTSRSSRVGLRHPRALLDATRTARPCPARSCSSALPRRWRTPTPSRSRWRACARRIGVPDLIKTVVKRGYRLNVVERSDRMSGRCSSPARTARAPRAGVRPSATSSTACARFCPM